MFAQNRWVVQIAQNRWQIYKQIVLVNISLVLHRLETLESLDRLKELEEHDDLKSKLLFSVIVVRR